MTPAPKKPRGIIMQPESVRAILSGRKTVTRRLVKPQPEHVNGATWVEDGGLYHPCRDELCRGCLDKIGPGIRYPYPSGSILYVKEAFAPDYFDDVQPWGSRYGFRADWTSRAADVSPEPKWKSPLFLPREYARLWLRVLSVRVERVQDISEEDARAEGVEVGRVQTGPGTLLGRPFATEYGIRWDAMWRKKAPWAINPWVWAISFERVEAPR